MSYFISKKVDNSSKKIEWTIFPEDFRIAAYLYLWFSCLLGLYLTKTFGYPNVFEENAIKSIWGYNNLCVVLIILQLHMCSQHFGHSTCYYLLAMLQPTGLELTSNILLIGVLRNSTQFPLSLLL